MFLLLLLICSFCICFCSSCCSFCHCCYFLKFNPNWGSNSCDIFVVVYVVVVVVVVNDDDNDVVVFFIVLSQKPSIKILVQIGSVID